MAWVLKMDEVIESGLVHDFDASLSGIGQELGAGAYSMRYRAPRAGRAEASVSLGKACATLGLCRARLLPAVPGPRGRGVRALPRGRRGRGAPRASGRTGGGGGRAAPQAWLRELPLTASFLLGSWLAVRMAWLGGGRGFLSWQVIYKPLGAGIQRPKW